MATCPECGLIVPSGSNCLLTDTAWYEWTPGTDGTPDDPHTLEMVLSADPNQILTCGAGGALALMPAALTNPPAAQAYNSTNLTIANATWTTVTCNTELYDTDTMHSEVSNTGRVTFATAGDYDISFNAAWNKHVTGDRAARIRKNGTDIIDFDSKRTGGADLIVGHCMSITERFVATDYIEAQVQQTSGGNLLLLSESYSPILVATRVA